MFWHKQMVTLWVRLEWMSSSLGKMPTCDKTYRVFVFHDKYKTKTQEGNLLGATLSGCTSETSASLGKSPSVTAEQEEEIRRFFLQTSRDTPLLSPLLNSWFHYLLNYVLMGHLIEWQAINKFTCLKQYDWKYTLWQDSTPCDFPRHLSFAVMASPNCFVSSLPGKSLSSHCWERSHIRATGKPHFVSIKQRSSETAEEEENTNFWNQKKKFQRNDWIPPTSSSSWSSWLHQKGFEKPMLHIPSSS